MIDYPKAMQVDPDELFCPESARNLFQGTGLLVHNENSGFQSVLYTFIIKADIFLIRVYKHRLLSESKGVLLLNCIGVR